MKPDERDGVARDRIKLAKRLLMERKRMTEEKAHRLLQRTSMRFQKPLDELAEAVIISFTK